MNFYFIKDKFGEIKKKFNNSKKERLRIFIVFFALLSIFDYFMFCLHTEKNIFNIFPSFPLLEETKEIELSLPSIEAKNIIKEKRKVPIFQNEKRYAKFLFETFLKGSYYENTTNSYPSNIHLRNIWIHEEGDGIKTCIFDVAPLILISSIDDFDKSEQIFKEALNKTIVENIPGITNIVMLENGIPLKNLWSFKKN